MTTSQEVLNQEMHKLYSDHHWWLLGWLRKKLGCSHNAADVAQDTFVRVLGRKQEWGDVREPRAWLTTIARGLLVDHWRRRNIEQAWYDAVAALPPALVPSTEERMLALEALCRIDALLNELKPKVREAFLLSQLDGLTYCEIGARLGVGERMVKKYMAQAMAQSLRADIGLEQ